MATVKMPGLKPFARKLQSTSKSLSNTKRLHGEAVILYEQWVKQNFRAQGKDHDRSSLHWKKLSKTTLSIRRNRRRSPTNSTIILRDSGQLSLRWSRRFDNRQAEFKSAQNYSSLHERGGTSKLGNKTFDVPQRKIFPENKQGRKIIKPAIDIYLKRAFKP